MSPVLVVVGVAAIGLASGCDKVPLLAPSGSTIALSAPVAILPVNGTTQITANVISSGGQAVHNGTTITFTSNLGTFAPSSDVQTLNGRATVTFKAGGQSGVANITASSGGANISLPPSSGTGTGTTGGTTTTTPSSLTIKIGGAAATSLTLTASPTFVPASGGSSAIVATVLDANGNPLAGVPVVFTTKAGLLSASTADTDASGQARVTLTTASEAEVSATAGAVASGSTTTGATGSVTVKINAAPTVTITPNTTTTPTVGQLVTFTVVVTPATGGSAISDVELDFDDGNVESLGSFTTSSSGVSVSHAYQAAGTYLVKLNVTDASSQTISTSIPLAVAGVLTVELPAPSSPTTHPASVSFHATVTDTHVTIETYTWNFGDGSTATANTSSAGMITHNYSSSGTFAVQVTVTASDGSTGTASTSVTIP